MRNIWALCWVAGFAVTAAGCSDDRCETLCEYLDECTEEPVDCSDESDMEECEDDLDDFDADCEEAATSFTDCLDENEIDCDDVQENCVGEYVEFLEQCEGQLD